MKYVLILSVRKIDYFERYGSFLAFHGSGFGNWHAILRTGLRNLSGTSLMSTGAVYGSGIYLAADSNTSWGYSKVLTFIKTN